MRTHAPNAKPAFACGIQTLPASAPSSRGLTSIAIGVERFDVRDEHSANFASITKLVFLLMKISQELVCMRSINMDQRPEPFQSE